MRYLANDMVQIREAITRYHQALNRREHGDVACHKALNEIMTVLDMPWVQGKSAPAVTSNDHPSGACEQWGNEPCVAPRCDCPNRSAVSGKDSQVNLP
jgi:hypothetical protein